MGVETRVYIPNLTIDILLKFIKIFDINAELKDVELYKNEMYYIFFLGRIMTIHIRNLNIDKNKNIDKKSDEFYYIFFKGLPVNTHGLSLSLGYNIESIKMMKLICFLFGGYIKTKDIDDGPYNKIKKNRHKVIKEVFNET